MSRLDDELKAAFRRQEPSADFTERVLARLAVGMEEPQRETPQSSTRERWWQMLLAFWQAQRWAMAAAAVLLVAALGLVQDQRWREAASSQPASAHTQAATPPDATAASSSHEPRRPTANKAVKRHHIARQHRPPTSVGKGKEATGVVTTTVAAATSPNPAPKSEGEIAKEQLMKALYIASAVINEAKDVAIGGRD